MAESRAFLSAVPLASPDNAASVDDYARASAVHQVFTRFIGVIFALVLPIVCGTLFLLYCMIAFPGVQFSELTSNNLYHVALNVFANLVSMTMAYCSRGELNQRLRRVMLAALLVHAVLIIFVIVFRLYYSRTIVSLSLLSSIGLVVAMTLMLERWFPTRLGVVPSNFKPDPGAWLYLSASMIGSADADVRKYDQIIVDWGGVTDLAWADFISRAMLSGCSVQHVAKFIEEKTGRVSLAHFEPCHAMRTLESTYMSYVKRPIDIFIVLLLAPILLPILALAMLAILLRMGKPIFFTQDRIGRGGKPFCIYKLRTMHGAAQTSGNATQFGDRRVTPLGMILRRYRMDEIPQLFNVLRGDMSFVGPRPEQVSLTSSYCCDIPGFAYRSMVLPGITGWAQIRAGYAANNEETRNKLSYDLYYVKHASFILDLWIIMDTARSIIWGTSSR